GIAARHQDCPVRPVRAGRPDLLPVDHPLVARALRLGAEAGEVGAGAGLGEELAPYLLAAQGLRCVPALLLLGAEGEERGHAHAEADLEVAARHEVARLLLRVDHLIDGRQGAPAPFHRPVQGGESRLRLLGLELLGSLEALVAVAAIIAALPRLEGAALGLRIDAEPLANFLAELCFFRSVVEVHADSPSASPTSLGDYARVPAECRAKLRADRERGSSS